MTEYWKAVDNMTQAWARLDRELRRRLIPAARRMVHTWRKMKRDMRQLRHKRMETGKHTGRARRAR